jgi:hypothetical protein
MAYRPDESDRRDDLDDWENPDSHDTAQCQGHSVDLAKCPYCGKMCAAMAEVCPHCHSFVHVGFARHYPWWIWVGLLAAAAATAVWVIPL